MISYVIITDNDEKEVEKWIRLVSKRFKTTDELIFFDNHSSDNSVPKIIEMMGANWKDEDHFKFYINNKKEPFSVIRKKAFSICRGKHKLIGGNRNVKNK